MSGEDSKQLSVAELLARNGAQGAAQSSGGGRRRRGGRGISVAELTGDLPVIREGGSHSAHAAPEPEAAEPPAYEAPAYEPQAWEQPAYEPPSFDPAQFATPDPTPYTPPAPEPEPSYSPMSGPITRYDPLSSYAGPDYSAPDFPAPDFPAPDYSAPRYPVQEAPAGHTERVMPGREMPGPSSRHSAPEAPPDPYGSAATSFAPEPAPAEPLPTRRSGRRRRPEPDEAATEVYRVPEPPQPEPVRPDRAPRNGRPPLGGPNPEPPDRDRGRPSRAARRRAAEEAEQVDLGPSTAAWSPVAEYAPEPAPPPPLPRPEPQDPGPRRPPRRDGQGRDGGALPAWSARRHKPAPPNPPMDAPESGGLPTAAWSLASQDQPLISGQTVAGDLLRDGVERAERNRRGRDRSREPVDLLDADEGLTDIYEPFGEADLLDEDDELDEPKPSRASRVGRAAKGARAGSRAARRDDQDANRRQWLILGGQSAGAAIAGMLLFKGFESMWEMLPWVALALAMIVILGLVALVRILRRTDDILSTVIAVVVGIFVTLGPLAFLLSTN